MDLVEQGAPRRRLPRRRTVLLAGLGVTVLAGSATVALSNQGDALPATRKPTAALAGPRGWVNLAFGPDGKTLVAGVQDGTVRTWKTATGRVVSTVTVAPASADAVAVAFSPDGRTLAAGGSGGVTLWDITTWRPKGRLASRVSEDSDPRLSPALGRTSGSDRMRCRLAHRQSP